MTDESLDDHEAIRRFVADLVDIDAQGSAPDGNEQLTDILAEHAAECDRLEREQTEVGQKTRRR